VAKHSLPSLLPTHSQALGSVFFRRILMEAVCSSGNLIVDEIGKLYFSGNIIPETWFYTIVNESGKPNLLAINILADIVYWYRPTEVSDEKTGKITYKKKFRDKDFLQKSYADICN
ncbi:MAG: hypothetical protein K6E53_16315, partial [Lachnospiraceae bacterium]|nr:hypothetical protein [Lachnospiraceae bacterium]